MITADKDGRPVLKPNPGPSVEDLQRQERLVRDRALLSTDPLVARHRDELETGRSTTITVSQYQQLQGYRQDLRDWPESKGFPSIENRPVVPEWLIPILEE
ncbi:phage tail protein [Pseudomonas yamanorum]|nr:phage tail protein [Pseudomonas yamanorum]